MSRESQALLAGLDQDQLAAVTCEAPVLRVIAGAGSGKTRVITRRIAHRVATGEIPPDRVRAITFTRRAAGELRNRLGSLGLGDRVAASTFHAAASAEVNAAWSARGLRPPGLLTRRGAVIRKLAGSRTSMRPETLVGEIEWAKARMIRPSQYESAAKGSGRAVDSDPARVAEVFEKYESYLRTNRLADFDDLLRSCIEEMRERPAHAKAVRWSSRHVVVDEFQDLNPLQFALLTEWVGPEPDLTVVGDPAQAIYGWNGADSSYLVNFSNWFPNSETVVCGSNYRCSPTVLHVARAALGSAAPGAPMTRSAADESQVPTLTAHPDGEAEAASVARWVRDRRGPNGSWSDFAVLARTNAQLIGVHEALTAAGVPVNSRHGDGLLDRDVGKAVADRLWTSNEPLARVIADLAAGDWQAPANALGRRSRTRPASTRDSPTTTGAATRGTSGRSESDAVNGSAGPDKAQVDADLRLIVAEAKELLAVSAVATGKDLARWLSELGERGSLTKGVAVLTFHASKGLEWPNVALVGLEKGYVPSSSAITPAAQAEERRLLYVAATRAGGELSLNWARRRTLRGQRVERKPSPLLEPVADAIATAETSAAPSPPPPEVREARLRRIRRQMGSDTEIDLERIDRRERVTAWRARTARANQVAHQAVLSDAALTAIVEEPPVTEADLASVVDVGPIRSRRLAPALLALLSTDESDSCASS